MQCQVCGNHYENCFTVTLADEAFVFDCFECAIHALAPTCAHCGCRIVGHGVSHDDEIFCCEHCAREMGAADETAYASAGDDEDEEEDDDDEDADDEFEDDDDIDVVDEDEVDDANASRPGQRRS